MENIINSLVSQAVGVTDQQIKNFLATGPSDAQIVKAMETYGVSPTQMAQVTGLPEGQVAARVAATIPPGQTVTLGDTIVQPQYQTIGSGMDQQIGGLENVLTYKTGENKVGGGYNQYDPTGQLQRTGTQQEVSNNMLPFLLAAGGMALGVPGLGEAAAGTTGVGVGGLSALEGGSTLGSLGSLGGGAMGALGGEAALGGGLTAAGAGGLGGATGAAGLGGSLGSGLTAAGAGGLGGATGAAGLGGALGSGLTTAGGLTAANSLLGGSALGSTLGSLATGVGAGALGSTLGGLATGVGTGALGSAAGSALGSGLGSGVGSALGTSLATGLGLSALGSGLGAAANQAGISNARDLINQYGTQAQTTLADAYKNAQGLNTANRTDLGNIFSNASTNMQNLYNQQVGYQQPYQDIGRAGSKGLVENQPYFTRQFGAADLNEQLAPNYAFMLGQGQMANQRAGNMGGGALGGNALQGLQRYTQDYAGNAYQNAFNNFNTQRQNIFGNLSNMAQIGSTSAGQLANLGANYGSNLGSLASNYGSNLTTSAGQGINAANQYGLNTAGLATGIGGALASNATQSGANTAGLLSNLGNTALLGSMIKAI